VIYKSWNSQVHHIILHQEYKGIQTVIFMASSTCRRKCNKSREILTAVKMPIFIFWVITSCVFVDGHQGLEKLAASTHNSTWYYNPEDQRWHLHHHEDLISHAVKLYREEEYFLNCHTQHNIVLIINNASGSATAQVVSCRHLTMEVGSHPGQCMWDLWWTKWHWDRFFLQVLRFSFVSTIPLCWIDVCLESDWVPLLAGPSLQ
jgi:hypothetical protein